MAENPKVYVNRSRGALSRPVHDRFTYTFIQKSPITYTFHPLGGIRRRQTHPIWHVREGTTVRNHSCCPHGADRVSDCSEPVAARAEPAKPIHMKMRRARFTGDAGANDWNCEFRIHRITSIVGDFGSCVVIAGEVLVSFAFAVGSEFLCQT